MLKTRSLSPEFMDRSDVPAEIASQFHKDLGTIHMLLGNWGAMLQRLSQGSQPESVIDIGCGDGALLREIRSKLGIRDVTGVDLKPPECSAWGIPIVEADATSDPLPPADVAISVITLHHLTDEQAVAMIRNVGRSARRFVCLDLVRHPLPLVLFSVFVCPLLGKVAAADGRLSIRKSYTPRELKALVEKAIAGSGATFDHWISPVYARQIVDIRWP